jgi:2-haloacid dehalogenase
MPIEALVFDVFGTLVDWRSGVAREAARVLKDRLPDEAAAGAFADAWRARYQPGMDRVRSGARPWVDLDTLHAEGLEEVLAQVGIADADAGMRRELVQAWHRLDAWPEVPGALARLKVRYMLAPLSNAHIRMAIAHARRNALPWDTVLGAEFAQGYKPQPAVYERAVAALRLQPAEVLMVAAHSSDLKAAAACGLATAHVARPHENGPAGGETGPSVPVDFAARDLEDLADQLVASARAEVATPV